MEQHWQGPRDPEAFDAWTLQRKLYECERDLREQIARMYAIQPWPAATIEPAISRMGGWREVGVGMAAGAVFMPGPATRRGFLGRIAMAVVGAVLGASKRAYEEPKVATREFQAAEPEVLFYLPDRYVAYRDNGPRRELFCGTMRVKL